MNTMSQNNTNLSVNASCFTPRTTQNIACHNVTTTFQSSSYESNLYFEKYGIQPMHQFLNMSHSPIRNQQLNQQLFYAWPHFPYALANQNLPLPVNFTYNAQQSFEQQNMPITNLSNHMNNSTSENLGNTSIDKTFISSKINNTLSNATNLNMVINNNSNIVLNVFENKEILINKKNVIRKNKQNEKNKLRSRNDANVLPPTDNSNKLPNDMNCKQFETDKSDNFTKDNLLDNLVKENNFDLVCKNNSNNNGIDTQNVNVDGKHCSSLNNQIGKTKKKKKNKLFVGISDFEKINGKLKEDNDSNKSGSLIKPMLKSYSAVTANNNNVDLSKPKYSIDNSLLKKSVLHGVTNTKDANEIKNIQEELSKSKDKKPQTNIPDFFLEADCENNIKDKVSITDIPIAKISYSAAVKKCENDQSNICETEPIKNTFMKKLKNKVKSEKNNNDTLETYRQNNLDTDLNYTKNVDATKNNGFNESNDLSQNNLKNNAKTKLASKNWTADGKLLFNEWQKSRKKYLLSQTYSQQTEENQPQLIHRQISNFVINKNKASNIVNDKPLKGDLLESPSNDVNSKFEKARNDQSELQSDWQQVTNLKFKNKEVLNKPSISNESKKLIENSKIDSNKVLQSSSINLEKKVNIEESLYAKNLYSNRRQDTINCNQHNISNPVSIPLYDNKKQTQRKSFHLFKDLRVLSNNEDINKGNINEIKRSENSTKFNKSNNTNKYDSKQPSKLSIKSSSNYHIDSNSIASRQHTAHKSQQSICFNTEEKFSESKINERQRFNNIDSDMFNSFSEFPTLNENKCKSNNLPVNSSLVKHREDKEKIIFNQIYPKIDASDHRTIVNKKVKKLNVSQPRNKSQPPLSFKGEHEALCKMSETPIILDIFKLITNKQTKNQVTKLKHKNSSKQEKPNTRGANVLDSTVVVRRRGKERVTPKKRLTTLKKIILKERMSRRSKFLEEYGLLRSQSLDDLNLQHLSLDAENIKIKDSEDETSNDETIYVNSKNVESSGCLEDLNVENNQKEENEIGLNISSDVDSNATKTEKVAVKIEMDEDTQLDDEHEELTEDQLRNIDPLDLARLNIHSRRFRDYCNHILSASLDLAFETLIKELFRFQDRVYHNDPMKYKMRRRYVLGLREVRKFLKLQKIKCLIIAPDIEKSTSQGSLESIVREMLSVCKEQNVMYLFSMKKRQIGKLLFKKSAVSVIGILNYEGAEDLYNKMISLVPPLCSKYNQLLSDELFHIAQELPEILQPFLSSEDALDEGDATLVKN